MFWKKKKNKAYSEGIRLLCRLCAAHEKTIQKIVSHYLDDDYDRTETGYLSITAVTVLAMGFIDSDSPEALLDEYTSTALSGLGYIKGVDDSPVSLECYRSRYSEYGHFLIEAIGPDKDAEKAEPGVTLLMGLFIHATHNENLFRDAPTKMLELYSCWAGYFELLATLIEDLKRNRALLV